MISGIFLSGVRVIALHLQDYLVEHQVPALEGGNTERVGHKADAIEIHGFLHSGSDVDKDTLQGMVGFMRHLAIPSQISGNYFVSGDILIDRLSFFQPAGKRYPYYEYVLRTVFPASGEAFFITSGIQGTVGYSPIPSLLIDYSQVLSIFASIHPDYSQVLPVNIGIHPDYAQVLPIGVSIHSDYSQVLPVGITEHSDYSQVLPLGASIHANYVRIS